jgi:hypothetical protein
MAPRTPSLPFSDLLVIWLLAAVAAVALVGLVSTAAATATTLHHGGRPPPRRSRRRALERFAAAVADGDMVRAEVEARRAFGERRAQAGKGLVGACGRRPLASSDDHVVVAGRAPDAFGRLRGPSDLAQWFPDVGRIERPEGTQLVVAGVGLRLVAERWEDECVSFRAEGAGATISGHLTLRAVALPGAEAGVEVWVHLEAPASRRGRRLLRTGASVARAGLRRMESGLGR